MPGVPQKGVAALWLDGDDGWTFKNKGKRFSKSASGGGWGYISIDWLQSKGKSKVQTRKIIWQFVYASSEKLTVPGSGFFWTFAQKLKVKKLITQEFLAQNWKFRQLFQKLKKIFSPNITIFI